MSRSRGGEAGMTGTKGLGGKQPAVPSADDRPQA